MVKVEKLKHRFVTEAISSSIWIRIMTHFRWEPPMEEGPVT